MVFCVPDSFLGKGGNTVRLKRAVRAGQGRAPYLGAGGLRHQTPGVGLGESFAVASKEDDGGKERVHGGLAPARTHVPEPGPCASTETDSCRRTRWQKAPFGRGCLF